MTGFVDFVVSINKIALVAFFAVLGFLVYEIKKMIDEKRKKQKPLVPQFDNIVSVKSPVLASSTPLPPVITAIKTNGSENTTTLMIVIGIISLFGVAILIVISYNTSIQKQRVAANTVPIIREITSAGLKIYNESWKEIDNKVDNRVQFGKKIIIGIQTIVEADIDRARIKINTKDWQISDITTLFNPQLKVYYREYIVATGTAQLKIDAQLHSASDGWLGE